MEETDDRVVGTGEAAKLLGLSTTKIAGLADSGLLKSYRIPNGCRSGGWRHRRFRVADIVSFARQYGMPLQAGSVQ